MTKRISLFMLLSLFSIATFAFAQEYKVDMKTVKDGVYKGIYQSTSCKGTNTTEVSVNVSKGKIAKIELINAGSEKIKEESSEAFKMMIAKNDVEANAAAAKALKAAVYAALMQKNITEMYCEKMNMKCENMDMSSEKMDMKCGKMNAPKEDMDMTDMPQDGANAHDHSKM